MRAAHVGGRVRAAHVGGRKVKAAYREGGGEAVIWGRGEAVLGLLGIGRGEGEVQHARRVWIGASLYQQTPTLEW